MIVAPIYAYQTLHNITYDVKSLHILAILSSQQPFSLSKKVATDTFVEELLLLPLKECHQNEVQKIDFEKHGTTPAHLDDLIHG